VSVTYASALAACVARFGEPTVDWRYPDPRCGAAAWGRGPVVGLYATDRGQWLFGVADGVPVRCWPIASTTPLPDALDALDAAARWIAGRAP